MTGGYVPAGTGLTSSIKSKILFGFRTTISSIKSGSSNQANSFFISSVKRICWSGFFVRKRNASSRI